MFGTKLYQAKLLIAVAALAGSTLASNALAQGALTDGKGVLGFVPEDTPYLMTTGEPLPDKLMDEFEPKIDVMLKSYQTFMREMYRSSLAQNSADMSAEDMQKAVGVMDEFLALLSIDGLRNAGIERGGSMAIYGNGIIPVVRIDLADAGKFEKAIARIEEAAGEAMELAELDGNRYRYIGDEEGRIIVGVFDGDAVFTIAPGELGEKELKQLVGLTKPRRNIAKGGQLLQIAREYAFSNHYIGFIDIVKIVDIVTREPQGLDAAFLDGEDANWRSLSKVCGEEIRATASVAPRMVFGYNEVSVNAVTSSAIVEVRDDIAAGLATLSSLVPGVGADAGGFMSLGMSINIPAIYAFAEARISALEDDPYECEYFAESQAGVAQMRASLAQPLPPFISGLRGFNLIVDSLGDYEFGSPQPPRNVSASAVVAMDDAQSVFMMGAMMSPELAAVDLQPDGKPVPLALSQLQGVAEAAYAAMLDEAIAVAVGGSSRSRVTDTLTARPSAPPPFMSMSMDGGEYYKLIGASMMEETSGEGEDGEENPLPLPAREALRDMMLQIGEWYDRMLFNVHLTKRGVEVVSELTLTN